MVRFGLVIGSALAASVLAGCSPKALPHQAPIGAPVLRVAADEEPPLDRAQRREDGAYGRAGDAASAHGKYVDLIKTLDVPEDRDTYGDFNDYGAWGPGEWAGAMQPEGYWVYVAPTWYIWRAER
jgi:hypothetical protein